MGFSNFIYLSSSLINEKNVFLMNNIEASDSKNTFKRTFKMDSHITSYYKNVVQASFFDLYDDVSVL